MEESPEEALETPPRQNVAVVDGDDGRAFFQRALNLDGVAVAEPTPAVQARITSSLRRKPDRVSRTQFKLWKARQSAREHWP